MCAAARHNQTVGREVPPYSAGRRIGPADWPPQCNLQFYADGGLFHATCLDGSGVLGKVQGWDFDSTAAAACDACGLLPSCTGWRTVDNRTAELLTGRVRPKKEAGCVAGKRYHSSHGGGAWGAAGDLGGYWLSTPITAECPAGAPLGTGGCAWRVREATYRNASCVDGHLDVAVEAYGARCFERCSRPLNRTSSCYLDCYKNALLGDDALNLTAMPHAIIVKHWKAGFDAESAGGCPEVTPAPCEGPQCGPP